MEYFAVQMKNLLLALSQTAYTNAVLSIESHKLRPHTSEFYLCTREEV